MDTEDLVIMVIILGRAIIFVVTPMIIVEDTSVGSPCTKEACCDSDYNVRAFSCDGMECPRVIPNWTKPECDP